MAFFIVLEALDGVGKTTLVKNLVENYGYKALDTPGIELKPFQQQILTGLGESQTARALFYAATVQAEGQKAMSLRRSGQCVVMDRYSASTIAYAKARGVTLELDTVLSQAAKPDLTILLTLNEQERRERLKYRGTNKEDLETLDDDFRQQVLIELRQRSDAELNLSGNSEQEAIAKVTDCIRARLNYL